MGETPYNRACVSYSVAPDHLTFETHTRPLLEELRYAFPKFGELHRQCEDASRPIVYQNTAR